MRATTARPGRRVHVRGLDVRRRAGRLDVRGRQSGMPVTIAGRLRMRVGRPGETRLDVTLAGDLGAVAGSGRLADARRDEGEGHGGPRPAVASRGYGSTLRIPL